MWKWIYSLAAIGMFSFALYESFQPHPSLDCIGSVVILHQEDMKHLEDPKYKDYSFTSSDIHCFHDGCYLVAEKKVPCKN